MESTSLLAFLLHLLAQSGLWKLPLLGRRLGEAASVSKRQVERGTEEQTESAQDPLTKLARSLAREAGADAKSSAAIRFYKAYALETMGRVEEALAAYERCQAVPASVPAARYAAVACFRQGLLLSQLSHWGEAERRLERSIQLAEALPLPNIQLSAASLMVRICRTTGRLGPAMDWIDRVLDIARFIGDESTQAHAFDAKGDLERAFGRHAGALQSYEQSLDLFRKLGNGEATLVTKLDIGALYQGCGRWDKAMAWYRACLREAEQSERTKDEAAILYELAGLHVHKGEAHVAAQLLLRDMALYRKMHDAQGADRAGRMLLGLGVSMQRQLTADQLTFRDIERGSAGGNDDDGDGEPDKE